MKINLSIITAIFVGLTVLGGYFFSIPALVDVQRLFLDWGLTLLGVLTLVGVLHLLGVHWRKFFIEKKRNFHSLLLLFAFGATLVYGLMVSPADAGFQHIVTDVLVPLESSLLAMAAISLAYVCLRLLQRRKDMMTLIFAFSVVAFLITGSGFLALAAGSDVLKTILVVMNRLPVAGGRGLLLGIALGSLTTGLRILLGSDRPYSG